MNIVGSNDTRSDTSWHLECFGVMRALQGEQVIERFRTQKTAALLVLLALRGRHTREGICALLWPDSAPEAARSSLSSALTSLRRDLGEHVLLADRQVVALAPATVSTDVAAFDQALKQADWARAVELYRGPLLPDFFEEPFPALNAEYEEKARAAFQSRLQELENTSGEAETLRSLARRAAQLFGDDERWFLALMRAHRMAGDLDAALRAYEALQRYTRKSGETASEEARQLSKSLRREKQLQPVSTAASSAEVTVSVQADAASPNLPAQWTRFFGREAERDLLRAWLNAGEKLITLSGPGGSGKTRLALETLREMAPSWNNSVYFVPLASLSDVSLLFSPSRDALSITARSDLPPLEQIERALSGRCLLLLLDNFEQLVPMERVTYRLCANGYRRPPSL
jgi:DNA-binding SARP family transcriptional activator